MVAVLPQADDDTPTREVKDVNTFFFFTVLIIIQHCKFQKISCRLYYIVISFMGVAVSTYFYWSRVPNNCTTRHVRLPQLKQLLNMGFFIKEENKFQKKMKGYVTILLYYYILLYYFTFPFISIYFLYCFFC